MVEGADDAPSSHSMKAFEQILKEAKEYYD